MLEYMFIVMREFDYNLFVAHKVLGFQSVDKNLVSTRTVDQQMDTFDGPSD